MDHRTTPSHRKKAMHYKCRNAVYPRSSIKRWSVPDDKVNWDVEFPEYNPEEYTDAGAKGKPWSDPDAECISSWNTRDVERKIERTSHEGPYVVENHAPRNPVGRTGVQGRGCLGRWGPNHAADPIVTRWKRDEAGVKVIHPVSGKPILQFIAIQRKDNQEWAIPGGMVDPGESVTVTLRREFGEEALNSLEADPFKRQRLKALIDNLFQHGFEIYRGYVDDPRNTDNSWMETVAYNFHDEDGSSVARFKLNAGDDAVGVRWLDINSDLKLFASHVDMIKNVVDYHDAHWSDD